MRNLGGFLHGGMTTWREEGRPVERIERLLLGELKQRHDAGERSRSSTCASTTSGEAATSRGRSTRPYHDIDGIPDGIDAGAPIAAVCGSGQRSGVAASLLQRFGAERVIHVAGGGVAAWQELGGAVESGPS